MLDLCEETPCTRNSRQLLHRCQGFRRPERPPAQPKTIKTIAANKHVTNGKISLIVPLYDFGYVSNLMSAQTHVVEETVHEKERVRQDLLFAVADSL